MSNMTEEEEFDLAFNEEDGEPSSEEALEREVDRVTQYLTEVTEESKSVLTEAGLDPQKEMESLHISNKWPGSTRAFLMWISDDGHQNGGKHGYLNYARDTIAFASLAKELLDNVKGSTTSQMQLALYCLNLGMKLRVNHVGIRFPEIASNLERENQSDRRKDKKNWWTDLLYNGAQSLKRERHVPKDAFDSIVSNGISGYDNEVGNIEEIVLTHPYKGTMRAVSYETFLRKYWRTRKDT